MDVDVNDRVTEMLAARRVDPYEAAWGWVKNSPPYFWTRGKLARALEAEHPGEGRTAFRYAIANMVATGVLVETKRPGSQRKRERLLMGSGLLARAREREIANLAAKLHREQSVQKPEKRGRVRRVVQW